MQTGEQLGAFRDTEIPLAEGDSVSVIVPWPAGPECRDALVVAITADRIHLEIDCGSGWKVEVDASKRSAASDIDRSRFGSGVIPARASLVTRSTASTTAGSSASARVLMMYESTSLGMVAPFG